VRTENILREGWRKGGPWRRLAIAVLAFFTVASLASLACVALLGGCSIVVGSHQVLAVHDALRPLVITVVAALACLRVTLGSSCWSTVRRLRPSATWFFAILMIGTAWLGLRGPLSISGDGIEYMIQTQSIVLNGTLRIDTDQIRDYWNRTNPFGVSLGKSGSPSARFAMAHGGYGGLFRDRFGDWRYYHFWAYPLAVAPLWALTHFLSPGSFIEYNTFRFVNVCCLLIPFVMAWYRRGGWALLSVCTLVLISPLISYADWESQELFCFCLVFSSFWLVDSSRYRFLGPLCLGVAASQNVPIMLFFPLHGLWMIARSNSHRWRDYIMLAVAYLLGAGLAVSSMSYFKFYFDVPSVIEKVGLANLHYATIARTMHVFFSPATGVLWMFPACFLFLTVCANRKNIMFVAGVLVTLIPVVWLTTSTSNLNAGQVGSVRYAVWFLAPLWYVVLSGPWLDQGLGRRAGRALFIMAVTASLLLIGYFRTWELLGKNVSRFYGGCRNVSEVAALYSALEYHDDVEVLAETVLGHHLQSPRSFSGVYIWNLGTGKSLWVISRRDVNDQGAFVWKTEGVPVYRSIPEGNVVFAKETDSTVRLAVGQLARFTTNTVLGAYILVWVDREVGMVSSTLPVRIADPGKSHR